METIWSVLIFAAVLVCPLAMVLMMLPMMRRGGRGHGSRETPAGESEQLAALEAEHARLAERIAQLEEARAEHQREPVESKAVP
jgi:hypothetical protein